MVHWPSVCTFSTLFFLQISHFPTRSICSTIKSSLSWQSMILLGEIRFQECCYFSWIGHHAMAGNSSAILSRFSSSGSLLSPIHTYPRFWVEKGIVRDWSPRKYRILLKIIKKNLLRTSFTTTNLLFGITFDTFSRFTNPSSASLIVVWTIEAFWSLMVVSFFGSVVIIWITMLKSTTTLPFLKNQRTKIVLENSHTVATMIYNVIIYRKMKTEKLRIS